MSRLTLTLALSLTLATAPPLAAGMQEAETTTWKGTLDAGGTKLRLEIDITTDAQGQATGELRSLDQGNAKLTVSDIKTDGGGLSFSIAQIGASYRGTLSDDGGIAQGTFSQGGAQLPLTLAKADRQAGGPESAPRETLKEAWVGKLEMGAVQPIMQFRIVATEGGGTAAYFDSITEGRTGFTAEWSIDGDTIRFDVASISLSYRGTLNAARDTAVGTWSQAGREFPLTLERRLTEYVDANTWENRPQRPQPPFPYSEEEVAFENLADGVTLAGTLTVPEAAGRHPAVILITGSGAQDRDESLMGHKPFLVLADYLTRRGIAVLRYDDRGTAKSTGRYVGATVEDFARDASAGVDFLKRNDRIDPARIGLAGHSEGGLVAPIVATQRGDIAFLVLLAATGVDGAAVIQSQTAALSRAAGAGEAAIEVEQAVNRAVFEVVLGAEPGADFTEDLWQAVEAVIEALPEAERESAGTTIRAVIKGQMRRLNSPWLRHFLVYDPRPMLNKVACPVLAITGSKDLQVLPDLNLGEIERALKEGGNADFEIVKLPGLNHFFQQAGTGSMSEYASIQETFNPAALERIGDWIAQRVTPRR